MCWASSMDCVFTRLHVTDVFADFDSWVLGNVCSQTKSSRVLPSITYRIEHV